MNGPTSDSGDATVKSTGSSRAEQARPRAARRFVPILCFGCVPGLLVGLVAGAFIGLLVWDYAAQQAAMNPLAGLNVPAGRLDFKAIHQTVDTLAGDYLAEGGSVGLAVGVIRGDETAVWCYGRRVQGAPAPPDGDTLFELASVGKTFTALLLAELHISGSVALDDSLKRRLPETVSVPALNRREITLLDLATQTSGLPNLPPDFPLGDPLNPYKDYSTAALFADLGKIRLTRAPGSEYEYSNLGFGLLGEALARVEGESYEQLVINRICRPLGMSRTRMTLTDELRANLAAPHDGGKPVPVWEDVTMPGAGSFLSTADDMLRYLRLFVNPSPETPQALVRAAQETTIKRRKADLPSRSMGLGWHIDSENANDIVWHNGAAGGSRSYAAFTVSPPCGVVVLSNSGNPVDDLGHRILYLLLQSDL